MSGLYLVKCNWYDNDSDTAKTSCAFVFADNYSEAVEKINNEFQYINFINVEEIYSSSFDSSCLYVPNDDAIIAAIKEENAY